MSDVNDLSVEIKALRVDVHALATTQAVAEERHKALTDFRASTDSRLEAISKGIGEVKEALQKLVADAARTGAETSGRIAAVESKCSGCEKKCDTLRADFTAVERRVDVLEQSAGLSRAQVGTVAAGGAGGLGAVIYAVGRGLGYW